ncbi:MAG TPA: polysaccharide deacetylase family protein [Magnetospirillum sp.]|nr:polysaccharide deacetylase family protein [Magnetospirillum sp.]
MSKLLAIAAALLFTAPAHAEVIERLPTRDKVVALTFDACEGKGHPAFFDRAILDYLEAQQLPFTVFATGLFAKRNEAELARLSRSPLVEVENHSFDHPQHMERLSPTQVTAEVAGADQAIEAATGRKPVFFRFPAGNYDAAALAAVEASGHRVVHWRWPSGDPAKELAPDHLRDWVLVKTRPGDVLIFHINGRAPATHVALPQVVAELKRRGYSFVRLDQVLK